MRGLIARPGLDEGFTFVRNGTGHKRQLPTYRPGSRSASTCCSPRQAPFEVIGLSGQMALQDHSHAAHPQILDTA